MELENRCMGCMELTAKAGAACPQCGFSAEAEPASPLHLSPGTLLEGKYLVGKVLGQGGFGITYLAWDSNLGLKLAIKEFFPQDMASRATGQSRVSAFTGDLGARYEYGLEKFLQEARTLARFEGHPNIVSVRDFFRANGTAYIVMSYVEGITLKEYLSGRGGRIASDRARSLMMPVLDALREVHSVNILHRDVSPDNIFINRKGQVVLIDFGAARQAMGEKGRSLSIVLKPGYAPEEQYRSRGVQGPWTDIYAAAATYYHLVTGRRPPEALERLVQDDLEPPSGLGVILSASEERALLRALAVRAEDRFQTVPEFQGALGGLGPAGYAERPFPDPSPPPPPVPARPAGHAPVDPGVSHDAGTGENSSPARVSEDWFTAAPPPPVYPEPPVSGSMPPPPPPPLAVEVAPSGRKKGSALKTAAIVGASIIGLLLVIFAILVFIELISPAEVAEPENAGLSDVAPRNGESPAGETGSGSTAETPAGMSISGLTTSAEVDSEGRPLGATGVFYDSTPTVYVSMLASGVPRATELTSTWIWEEDEYLLADGSIELPEGDSYPYFSYSPAYEWAPGFYRVEISAREALLGTIRFEMIESSGQPGEESAAGTEPEPIGPSFPLAPLETVIARWLVEEYGDADYILEHVDVLEDIDLFFETYPDIDSVVIYDLVGIYDYHLIVALGLPYTEQFSWLKVDWVNRQWVVTESYDYSPF